MRTSTTKYNYFIAFLFFFSLSISGQAAEIKIDAATIKLPRPGQNITSGFMQLKSSEKLIIKKISNKYINNIEIHSMNMQNEVMKMRKMINPVVSPSNPLILRHGGNHLMLFGLNNDFIVGDEISLSFEFLKNDGETISKNFTFKVN